LRSICQGVLAALAHLHASDMVHRDLRDSSYLLDSLLQEINSLFFKLTCGGEGEEMIPRSQQLQRLPSTSREEDIQMILTLVHHPLHCLPALGAVMEVLEVIWLK